MESHIKAAKRLTHWARGIVLAETGQAVDLIHIEELEGQRRIFVEMPSGLRTYVPEAALTNRMARLAEGGLTLAGVALAGALLGYSFSDAATEQMARFDDAPSINSAIVSTIDG